MCRICDETPAGVLLDAWPPWLLAFFFEEHISIFGTEESWGFELKPASFLQVHSRDCIFVAPKAHIVN